jgi:3-deoxy-manno-octulosonate cytidylyltransferase (CMP-KDO synthetase)
MSDTTVLIPARLASSRLPNKPLADIAGLPMIVRVAQRVRGGLPDNVRIVVATDHASIQHACEQHDVQAILTRADHPSGSDRLAEACELLGLPDEATVVNVQGDEPLIDPALVRAVADLLALRPEASMSTAAHPIHDVAEFSNPNVVKVVLDARNLALYFSRAPIAWWRDGYAQGLRQLPPADGNFAAPLRHIGIYGYRVGFLRQFPKLAAAPIENSEALEQLRALWHGHRIAVHITQDAPGPGVDTPEDLERVRKLFAR